MKTKLRLISTILIMSLIFPIFSGIFQPVFAADLPVKVYTNQLVDYNATTGTLILRWALASNSNITDVAITYHVPDSVGARQVDVPADKIDIANKFATIDNIKNDNKYDIIYDFEVTLTDKNNQTYSGKFYFLPKISVYAEQVEQQSATIAGGGVETGVYPAMKLSWNMPVVYYDEDGDGSGTMEYANEIGMLQRIDPSLRKLDFMFHINDGKLANIEVKKIDNVDNKEDMYKAVLSGKGNENKVSKVKWDAVKGRYSFYILGAKDDEATLPTIDEILNNEDTKTKVKILPEGISKVSASESQYVLLHPEIRPGSIYVITMNTWFYNSNNEYSDAVVLGLPKNPLVGELNYTYTPVRFQLTKDSLDLVYVRIYRINSGSITMPDLYYEVQTNEVPSSADFNWKFRTELHDSNFSENAKYAITYIGGINPLNTLYYRVVVKSDAAKDKIQSLNLKYRMQDDMAKPPVPKNISVIEVKLEPKAAAKGEKTSNVTISWDKPSNWDQLMNDNDISNDIYFHFLLSVGPKDLNITPTPMLEADGETYGRYPVKYRLVKYVSGKSVILSPDKSKLIYTIKGLELFQWVDENGTSHDITMKEDDKDYPKYLLPNKTYYMQMYTTIADNKGEETDSFQMSDKSLIESFTTLSPTGRDVPTPKYLELIETTIDAKSPANATVKIRFDDLQIDWNNYTTNSLTSGAIYYDVYMSTSTEQNYFHLIGTTETPGNLKFDKGTANNTTWVNATINKFTGENSNKFGKSLAPNASYYFMVKVRLKMSDESGKEVIKESLGTALLPVTTPRGEPTKPDVTAKRPLAPTDFAIAEDSDGNPMVKGQTVTFEWTVQENAAAYNLIATSHRVDSNTEDTDSIISEDLIYKSFITDFGNMDRNIDGKSSKLTLDPKASQLPPNFEYNNITKKCRYTINTWLYPNKVYYFSLRSEIDYTTGPKSSLWVSIPVTTSLIESPSMLQVVNNCELPFYWYDTLADMTTENYKIMLKAPGDSEYTQLTKAQYTIVKDGTVYYGRILKLKPNMQYSVKVVRTTNSTSTDKKELSTITKYTRNDYYQIDVKWQSNAIDSFSGFEIAIKTEADSDYTVLNKDTDLEQYFDTSTQTTYPFYIEKSNSNLNTNYYTYNARIRLVEATDGTKEHRPLIPNTKYYIKVRAVKYDSSNTTAFTKSKYIGPVDTRTEFNQDDYDDDDNNTSVTAKFLDMLDKLEQEVFWDVNKKNGVTNKILVKDDKVINLLEGYGYFNCTIDISQNTDYVNSDEIYLAKDILKAMKTNNRSVIIKTKSVEYTIRPDTFNTEEMEEFKNAKAVTGSKDVYLKVNNTQSTSVEPNVPANATAVSKVNILSAQAVTSKQTSASVAALIKDKLYNDKTGIIQKKLAVIKNPNNPNTKDGAAKIDKYLNQLLEELKSELSYYLEDTLIGAGYTAGVLADKFEISKFNSPLSVKMPYKVDSIVNPYVIYGNVGNWKKLTQNLKNEKGYLSYLVSGTGKYAIFSSIDVSDTVAKDNPAKPYIAKLAANYDLTTAFPGIDVSFNADLNVTVKEAILLYELLSESQIDVQTDVKAKAKAYGVDKIINVTNIYRNITRQEAAGIIVKLYCQKTGTDYGKLKATYRDTIKDDNKIAEKYAAPVYLCLEMKIMNLDSNANFNPDSTINRSGMLMVLQKMLEV